MSGLVDSICGLRFELDILCIAIVTKKQPVPRPRTSACHFETFSDQEKASKSGRCVKPVRCELHYQTLSEKSHVLYSQYVKLPTDFCAIYCVEKIREKNPPDVTAAN
jgi:hypothetical protein